MSTLSGLMINYPNTRPYDAISPTINAINAASGITQGQTALLQLQKAREQQAAEQAMYAMYQANPDALFGGGGMPQSSLASLNAPAPGAITQGALAGQPGQTQTIPAYPDASRYAEVSPGGGGPLPAGVGMPTVTPPQSTISGLNAQPRQDPLRALMQQNPQAALMAMDLQARNQERQFKVQEQVLGMQEKKLAHFGQLLQGTTDQPSWDATREQIGRIDQRAAASLPPTFSKEARDRAVQQALSVKESLTLQVQDLQAQAALIKARKEGRSTDVDNQLRAMGVQPGQETPQQMREALQAVEEGKVRVSASHGTGQIVQTPQGYMRIRPGTNEVEQIQAPGGAPLQPKPSEGEQKVATFADIAARSNATANSLEDKSFQPGFWDKAANILPMGMSTYLQSTDYQQYRQAVREFAQAWLRKTSGAAVTEKEWEDTNQIYFPQPGEPKAVVEQKRRSREALVRSMQAEGQQTGRQPASDAQTSQGSSAPGGKVVSRADLHAENARRNAALRAAGRPELSNEQAEAMARQKGYTVR